MVVTSEDDHSKTLHIIIYYFLLHINDDNISISYSEKKTFKKIKNAFEIQNVNNIVYSNNNILTCLVHFYIIQY